MSFTGKSQTTQNHLYCDVCKINIATEAEYALHEFSKKHCDNLRRIAKNKPVVPKQKNAQKTVKTAADAVGVNKEQPKINVVTTQGNFAMYGYFVQGEVYDRNIETKEFNTEYDPYLQKYAENPLKEQVQPVTIQAPESPYVAVTNMPCYKRKKKKKIKTCNICNLTFLTVPEYEAHMRSPQHSWKLKMSGMGVSAHFVKASSDLHTVETNEDLSSSEECEGTNYKADNTPPTNSPSVFPTLYCDICELLLNSEQQFTAHVNGKSHNDNVQKKAEIKAKKLQMEKISLNQLYCFSCKVSLNNLQQYNEHKFGKKHKMKCRRLMKEGITIPPEERIASWEIPRRDPNKPIVYPEMYEKFLIESQKKGDVSNGNEPKIDNNDTGEKYTCRTCSISYADNNAYQLHINSGEHQRLISAESKNSEGTVSEPKLVFHNMKAPSEGNQTVVDTGTVNSAEESQNIKPLKIINFNEPIKCSVCEVSFTDESQFELHLSSEDHARKILEVKSNGASDEEILDRLINDRSVVRPDSCGRYRCSICSITTGNVVEYRQHVSSIVHRQSDEEYQNRRMIEVKSAIDPDETGTYTCKFCKSGYSKLTDYNQHLHMAIHREALKTDNAVKLKAKNRLLFQKKRVKQKYIISGLKRKDFACWRRNCEKSPGVKAKITEAAASEDGNQTETSAPDEKVATKRTSQEDRPNSGVKRTKNENCSRGEPEAYTNVKPLMSLNNSIPYQPQPPPLMSTPTWRPCYPPQLRGNFFPGYPRCHYPGNRYQRGRYDTRHPRHRYPPCYI